MYKYCSQTGNLGILRIWEDNCKMDHREVGCEEMNWIVYNKTSSSITRELVSYTMIILTYSHPQTT